MTLFRPLIIRIGFDRQRNTVDFITILCKSAENPFMLAPTGSIVNTFQRDVSLTSDLSGMMSSNSPFHANKDGPVHFLKSDNSISCAVPTVMLTPKSAQ